MNCECQLSMKSFFFGLCGFERWNATYTGSNEVIRKVWIIKIKLKWDKKFDVELPSGRKHPKTREQISADPKCGLGRTGLIAVDKTISVAIAF